MLIPAPARRRTPVPWLPVLSVMILAGLLASPGVGATANEVQGGGFEEPAKARHGERIEPPGFTIEGGEAKVTRFVGPAPHAQAVGLKTGGALELVLDIPTPPSVTTIAPEG